MPRKEHHSLRLSSQPNIQSNLIRHNHDHTQYLIQHHSFRSCAQTSQWHILDTPTTPLNLVQHPVTGLTGRQLMGPSTQYPLCLCVNSLCLWNQGGVLYSSLNVNNTAALSISIHGTQYWSASERSWALRALHRLAHLSLKYQLVEGCQASNMLDG